MTTYTTIFFDYNIYNANKHKLENLRKRFNVVWDNNKIKTNVQYDEILGIYYAFKTVNRIINDANLKGRSGITGVGSNDTDSIKIVIFSAKDVGEYPPVLLVYKGIEGEFYKTLVKMCIDIGCEIGKLIEDENGIHEVFKKKLSLEVIERIRSLEDSKEVMSQIFDVRIDELQKFGYRFSDSFISEWKRLIGEHGYYSNDDLSSEIEKTNKNNSDDN